MLTFTAVLPPFVHSFSALGVIDIKHRITRPLFCLQAVKEFIEVVSKKVERKTISPATALKFLLARKLDVQRAVALFEQHELIRKQEGLYNLDPKSDPLRSELETGKFTILVSECVSICEVDRSI